MNPQEHVCHNPRCWVCGRGGEGQIVIHTSRLWLDGAAAAVNTAAIARLNAPCRARLAPLVRRSRATVRQMATLTAGMGRVGTADNFCTPHRSRDGRTPAQAAGLTDHRWSLHALLTFPVPLPLVKHRGRPPHWLREVAHAA